MSAQPGRPAPRAAGEEGCDAGVTGGADAAQSCRGWSRKSWPLVRPEGRQERGAQTKRAAEKGSTAALGGEQGAGDFS